MSTATPMSIRKTDSDAAGPPGLSTSPNGTVYSSTPGGSRVIYDRTTLLELAESPLSKTPLTNMAHVDGVTKSSRGPDRSSRKTALSAAKKKEEEAKERNKQSFNPFALLNKEDDLSDMDE